VAQSFLLVLIKCCDALNRDGSSKRGNRHMNGEVRLFDMPYILESNPCPSLQSYRTKDSAGD
jgi:hypothetical protein